jgi:NAD(P)-dependent dehydrogenase (short-subunit alcohol dehydrogenase family)/AcrR family transcriptional regulator
VVTLGPWRHWPDQASRDDIANDTSYVRKQSIIAAANDLLEEGGLEGLTIRAVLKRTGLARRAFYERFAGKDDLVLAVFEETLADSGAFFAKEIAGLSDTVEMLRIIVVGLVVGALDNDQRLGLKRVSAIVREHMRLAQTRPAELESALRPLLDVIADPIRAGIRAGQLRDCDPVLQATLIYNLVASTIHTELLMEESGEVAGNRRQRLADEIWNSAAARSSPSRTDPGERTGEERTMEKDLAGKTALVTGGGRGIGRAMAERLAAAGAIVAVNYAGNHEAAADTVRAIEAAGGTAFAVQAKIGEPGEIDRLVASLDAEFTRRTGDKAIDILVNNIGGGDYATILDSSDALYDQTFSNNVRGPFLLTRALYHHIRDNGRVINISSTGSRLTDPGIIVYSMAKAAVEAFTRVLAAELGGRGSRSTRCRRASPRGRPTSTSSTIR